MLGLFWRPGNGTSAIASFVVGVGTLLLWRYVPFGSNIHQVFPAILFSTVVYAVTAHLGTSHQAAELDELFASD